MHIKDKILQDFPWLQSVLFKDAKAEALPHKIVL